MFLVIALRRPGKQELLNLLSRKDLTAASVTSYMYINNNSSIAPFVSFLKHILILSYTIRCILYRFTNYYLLYKISMLHGFWVSEAGFPSILEIIYWCFTCKFICCQKKPWSCQCEVPPTFWLCCLQFRMVEVYKKILGCGISMDILNLIYQNLPILVSS